MKKIVFIALLANTLLASEPSAPAKLSSPPPSAIVPSQEVVRRLMEGNDRFIAGQTRHPNQSSERRQAIARGQNPIAVVLTCADSRVSPELLFDQGLGDLFVIRNAGNVLDDHVLGSIEYAVSHLNVSLVMVLGHSGCGAAKATLEGGHAPGHVSSIVDSLKVSMEASREASGDKLDNLIRRHVQASVSNIEKSKPILEPAVAQGRLRVVGARYNLETGRVEMVGSHRPK